MRMRQFWRFVRDAGLRTASISLAQINRIMAQGKRFRFEIFERRKGSGIGSGPVTGFGGVTTGGGGAGGRIAAADSAIFGPSRHAREPDFDMYSKGGESPFRHQ